MHRLRQGSSPCGDGIGLEDQPGALRQQQVLSRRQRSRTPGRGPGYTDRIVIRQDGRILAEHPRSFGRGETISDPWHYVPVLARKPGALRNGAPFKDWELPAALERSSAGLPALTTVIGRWSTSSTPC